MLVSIDLAAFDCCPVLRHQQSSISNRHVQYIAGLVATDIDAVDHVREFLGHRPTIFS
jgi:hypothetical protein